MNEFNNNNPTKKIDTNQHDSQETSNIKVDENSAEENEVEEKNETNLDANYSKNTLNDDVTPQLSEEELVERELREFRRNQIEAALYVAGKPLTIEELNTKLEIPKNLVEELINELAFDYLERSTAIVINHVGEKYQMALKPEYIEGISKFAKGGAIAERYLRTLTIIALKQPILKSLVIKLRGTGAYEHIKYLLENEFISAAKKGRSDLLTTTDKYAEMFGLPKNIEEMKNAMISQLGLEQKNSENDQKND